jgi:two-component system phosphate regulon sensor histidine kinase PhoR
MAIVPDTRHENALGTLAALTGALPDPVFIVGGDLRVLTANSLAEEAVTGLRAGALLAMVLRDPDVIGGARRVLSGEPVQTVIWRERVPVERQFEVSIAPLELPAVARVIVVTLKDRTEAQRVERMRVDFIANASHELRTPLASLLGFVETLRGAARNDEGARDRFLAIMEDQAQRMARLIEDLLSLSRIEQNLHVRPNAAVDLALVVQHIVDTLAPLARETGARLDVAAEPETIVSGDRDELTRLAENLIENAMKYGVPAGAAEAPVEVRVTRNGRDAVLTVRDHGSGIAPEHLPRLTERFYRIDAGQSRAKGGTGLGLAIVKHIVARHGGRMTIESHLGHGAAFRVSLPLR